MLFAFQMSKPYVFSLVFALTSRNKGNFLFSADYFIQQPCGSTLRFPCSVSVDVHRGTDIGVSEKLLHIIPTVFGDSYAPSGLRQTKEISL